MPFPMETFRILGAVLGREGKDGIPNVLSHKQLSSVTSYPGALIISSSEQGSLSKICLKGTKISVYISKIFLKMRCTCTATVHPSAMFQVISLSGISNYNSGNASKTKSRMIKPDLIQIPPEMFWLHLTRTSLLSTAVLVRLSQTRQKMQRPCTTADFRCTQNGWWAQTWFLTEWCLPENNSHMKIISIVNIR